MKQLKETLNLPTTRFSMKANLSQKEPGILEYWKEINLYQYYFGDTYELFLNNETIFYENKGVTKRLNEIFSDINYFEENF